MCYPFAQLVKLMVPFLLPGHSEEKEFGDDIQRSGRRALLIPDVVEEVSVDIGASVVVASHGVVPPTRARVARRGRRRR